MNTYPANGVVVVGTQWGAEGKGKLTDLLAAESEATARYQGGPNTGHTVVVGGEEYRLRLVPAGLLRDGVLAIIGNGCVVDPVALVAELEALAARGIDTSLLRISRDAHVVFPHHRALDILLDERRGTDGVGTTREGIGPCYADKALRLGVRMGDLTAPDLAESIAAAIEPHLKLLGKGGEPPAEIAARYASAGEWLAGSLADTAPLIWEALGRGLVLFEGAQGTLLDVDHGTYPWVTSSSAIAGGACSGTGIGPSAIAEVWGVAKAYVTRVGGGDFPTELSDDVGDLLQRRGHEWGTTTRRRRRCGWLDLVALSRSVAINGINRLAVTKLDVLSGIDQLQVAVGYEPSGNSRNDGWAYDRHSFPPKQCRYATLEGWAEDLSGARKAADLPRQAREYLDFIADFTGVSVAMAGVGPERDQVVWLEEEDALMARLGLRSRAGA